MSHISSLQKFRYEYKPKLPSVFQGKTEYINVDYGEPTEAGTDQKQLRMLFPKTYGVPAVTFTRGTQSSTRKPVNIGVILSGGQAPGGHNVIAGIFDALKEADPRSVLYGFRGGPSGIIDDDTMEITAEIMDSYRNTGGFDIIGSGRTKLETVEQFEKSLKTCQKYDITAVVIIGGDDSNTNGAILAEWFLKRNAGISVVGCPKTIDGDLKNQCIETSFGFDTATKVFSELIGNIEKDACSAGKYWHFIKLMGRSASHIALECALQTQPNICIISEEVKARAMSLDEVVGEIVCIVVRRAERDMNFGVILIPEGLIEFIPEVGKLITEINELLTKESRYFESLKTIDDQCEWINHELSKDSSYVYSSLPRGIQTQLLDDRDPHGNVQVSRIDTEKLLMEIVGERLKHLKQKGKYRGNFSGLAHFFGYEGRCAFPSNFDSDYCYSLGYSAFLLIDAGLTGYIASIRDLHKPAEEWIPGGIPLTMMMNMELRHGEFKPVIKKALVEMDNAAFKTFAERRNSWILEGSYKFPGAIQYFGPPEVCDKTTETLRIEKTVTGLP